MAALLKTKDIKKQEEYFTIVQMIVKDEGYFYFAARATFKAWSCLSGPPTDPHTHTHTNKKETVCLIPIATNAQVSYYTTAQKK